MGLKERSDHKDVLLSDHRENGTVNMDQAIGDDTLETTPLNFMDILPKRTREHIQEEWQGDVLNRVEE